MAQNNKFSIVPVHSNLKLIIHFWKRRSLEQNNVWELNNHNMKFATLVPKNPCIHHALVESRNREISYKIHYSEKVIKDRNNSL